MKNSINNTNTLNLNNLIDTLLNNSGIRTTNLDNVYEGLEPSSGTFKGIYRLYKSNQVKLITKNGQVIGLDIEGGRTHTEDMLAGMRFEYIYRGIPVQKYIEVILELQLKGITLKANQIKETADVVTLKLEGNKAIKISKRSGQVTEVVEAPQPKAPKAPKEPTVEEIAKLWAECFNALAKEAQGKKAQEDPEDTAIRALFNPEYEDYE